MAHAPAAFGSFPRRRANTGFPAHPGLARPQRMAERAVLRLVLEQGHRHEMIMQVPLVLALVRRKDLTQVRMGGRACSPGRTADWWRSSGSRSRRSRSSRSTCWPIRSGSAGSTAWQDSAVTWKAPDVERPGGPTAGPERPLLQAFLDWHRATLLFKCAGLTGEQLAERTVPTSGLSL